MPISDNIELFEKKNQKRIVLVGHGMWVPGDGWITVPQGQTIHFYVPDGGLLANNVGNAIEGFSGSGNVPKPVESIHGGGWVRNYRLTYASGLSLNGTKSDAKFTWITVREKDRTIQLSILLKDTRCLNATELHWAACREIKGHDKVDKYAMQGGSKIKGQFSGDATFLH